MAAQRIYSVIPPYGDVRLVKAISRSQALSHVANSLFSIRVATQEDLVHALSNGIKVEAVRDGDQLFIEGVIDKE